jgi:hypothetical protein
MRNRTSLLGIALWQIPVSRNTRHNQMNSKKHSDQSIPHDACRQLSPNFPPRAEKRITAKP